MNILEWIEEMFRSYGYLVLLIGLPLDFIALPIPPGQTTLTYTGYLTFKGTLELLPAILAAYVGSVVGITVTYLIGHHVGAPLLQQYGKWFLIKPSHLERTRKTYDKYGNKMLFISFFVPGVRQLFGYFVGIIKVPYKTFALYAYPGALIWVSAFIGIGYIFGEQWTLVIRLVEKYLALFFGGVFILIVLLLAMRRRKWKRWQLRQTEIDKK